jgi:hypothetical protein
MELELCLLKLGLGAFADHISLRNALPGWALLHHRQELGLRRKTVPLVSSTLACHSAAIVAIGMAR